MHINGSTALITGSNRGLGRHFAQQLVQRGAKVYAGARNIESVDLEGVIPVQIDITDSASVARAAETTSDVSILINNAGGYTGATLLSGSLSDIELDISTHYLGTLRVIRAFAPQLSDHPKSAILNVLSVLSWVTSPEFGSYSAAKSAGWAMTNALRLELAAQQTQVSALHVGYIDTDMASHVDAPKSDPADVARIALDGLEAGDPEIIADELSKQIRAGLAGGVAALYPEFA
ncbi:SDR family oxidoreductase [Mycolicibacterium komossense]|uniref:SDR family oxidoreductase n=1 Tax=Mycolicibacterium komossense TaxID=1779 RepID=A0ABT3CFC2_9MYCO|nr:SDR family oxidoreductase [Mycolicibacterium komossense]MCV7228174.1 SDR family oxidoreductase [Mycolicibacterium komossense]